MRVFTKGSGDANGRTVPVQGYLWPGGVIRRRPQDGNQELEEVVAPPEEDGTNAALIVDGAGLAAIVQDQDIIYYQNMRGDPAAFLDRACVALLADSRRFLGIVLPGSTPGRFSLSSGDVVLVSDVEIEWAAPITWIQRAV